MTIRRMRIACWIPKATDTQSEHVILIAFLCISGCTNAPQRYSCLTLGFPYFSPIRINWDDSTGKELWSKAGRRYSSPWSPKFVHVKAKQRCEFLGFRISSVEVPVLVGCYALSMGDLTDVSRQCCALIFKGRRSPVTRRLGTTSHKSRERNSVVWGNVKWTLLVHFSWIFLHILPP